MGGHAAAFTAEPAPGWQPAIIAPLYGSRVAPAARPPPPLGIDSAARRSAPRRAVPGQMSATRRASRPRLIPFAEWQLAVGARRPPRRTRRPGRQRRPCCSGGALAGGDEQKSTRLANSGGAAALLGGD